MDKETRQLIFTASQRRLSMDEYQKLLASFEDDYRFRNLKKVIERVKFGKMELVIKDGFPVQANEVIRQIKLDSREGIGL
ncbi:MAG: hypothetical protein WC472_01560 [Candidatus Paceibacterota bacterium]